MIGDFIPGAIVLSVIGVPLAQWPKPAVDYAMGDPKYTLDVLRNQEDRAREMFYSLPDAEHQARADYALRLTSVWGMETDRPTVEKARADLRPSGEVHDGRPAAADDLPGRNGHRWRGLHESRAGCD